MNENAHTTVSIEPSKTNVKDLVKQHSSKIGAAALVLGFVVLNRAMLRKELRQLNFVAEFSPYDDFDEVDVLV